MTTLPAVEPAEVVGARRFSLQIPMLKMLTSKEELAMARAAYAQAPGSAGLRARLAQQLLFADRFDEVIALLDEPEEEQAEKDLGTLHTLSTALLGRETEADDQRALQVAERALALSGTARERALTLTELAKVHRRLGQAGPAEALLQEALQADPKEKDAYKRLFHAKLQRSAEEALEFARTTLVEGARHSRVLGSIPVALARLERFDEARQAEGSGEFLVEREPAPPAGWASLAEFNEALAAEALQHPDTRYNRYGVASAQTWRLDEPVLQRTRCFQQLQKLIEREVVTYAESLAGDHAWVAAMPERASLRNWTVIVEGEGHETWHVHQNGWMSGVYYIHVPEHIAQGTGSEGCIAFGLPEGIVGIEAAAAFGERLVRPHSGLMMMFPSHVFHRTYPHHGSGRRICYAFDIVPVEPGV